VFQPGGPQRRVTAAIRNYQLGFYTLLADHPVQVCRWPENIKNHLQRANIHKEYPLAAGQKDMLK
jgi:hypothetical protein